MDERNFRSVYYEKVGFKSVEEKKSLEMLLKDKTLDVAKLKQFCLRFAVPVAYRNYLWKLILGVIPVQVECHTYVMNHRKQEYDDLQHALLTMRIISPNSPKSYVLFAMWLLQTGQFSYDLNMSQNKTYINIVKSVMQMQITEDDTDIFWIAKKIVDAISKFQLERSRLVDAAFSLLEKEDPDFHKYLVANDVVEALPVAKWFECCFAGVINDKHLGRIWDKICGGSYKILVYVVVVLLTTLKHRIVKCKDNDAILECIKNLSEETTDIIVNKSIDMWQQFGSPLTIHDKTKT